MELTVASVIDSLCVRSDWDSCVQIKLHSRFFLNFSKNISVSKIIFEIQFLSSQLTAASSRLTASVLTRGSCMVSTDWQYYRNQSAETPSPASGNFDLANEESDRL